MKTPIALCLFLTGAFLYGCRDVSEKPDAFAVVQVRSMMERNDSVSVKEDVESIQYIPLETSDSCLISNALAMRVSKDYIFVHNGKTDQIFQFSRSGKFIQQVGRQGNGPGEYNLVLGLALDEEKKELYVFHYSGVPVVYGFDGSFVRSDTVPATDMLVLPDGCRILKGLTMAPVQNAPWLAAVQDRNKVVTDSIVPYAAEWNKEVCYMQEIVFSPSSGPGVLAFTECNDTVFRLSGEGCTPAYVLERDNSSGYHQRVADISQMQNNPVQEDDITLMDCFETERFGYFRYFKGGSYYLQRLRKSDGSVLSQEIPESYREATVQVPGQDVLGIKNDVDGGVPFWPEFYVDSRTRAQMVTYENIRKLKEAGELGKLPDALDKMGEYDNPVVIVYTFGK